MVPRPRYKETPVDEEKLKHFSKRFEEQDAFSEEQPHHKEEDDEKAKKVLYRFAEVDEPEEEKKKRLQKMKEEALKKKEETRFHHKTAHNTKAEEKAMTAPSAQAEPQKPQSKAEAYAIQQYQAKLAEPVKARSPVWTGFLFGVGLLLFLAVIGIILFSIAVIMGISVSELIGKII